ncbi:MFS transporter [Pullulanibacillus sp. KACC 23026]|uniref:MFS transporter n=1 Tax=Pullulanibacillus sp. KACC 23026 TaxID=3028315 RepID=UPI0023B1624A|nr:MFS transporter [Pullulanibacillus sp. KACC 23026]WEG12349.1 MFS transporter [Pullulanibacillus sp. KACC 23026]
MTIHSIEKVGAYLVHIEKPMIRQTSFLFYWMGQILSSTSFQMLSVAIGWQMYSVTHDAFSLGFVGLAQFLPMILLTLVVGHAADRFDRRLIVFICRLVEGLIAILLLVGNIAGWLGREEILIAAAVLGACRAFEGPSSAALLPQLVSKQFLQKAIAWSTSGSQVSQILGPSLGGLLYAISGSFVYSVSAVALFLATLFTVFIRMEPVERKTEPVTLESLFKGLVFVFKHRVILGTISLDLFAVLLGGATALLPIFSQDILHTGPWGLGLMRTAPAIGALLMSFYLATFPIKRAFSAALFSALGVFGLATMLFAISTNLYLSLFALMVIGGSDVISVVIRSSLVQLQTPDEMRGRVNAVNSLFIGTSNQLGEFESGMVAGFLGAVPAAFIGGLGTIVIAGLWMYLFPPLRRIRSLSES